MPSKEEITGKTLLVGITWLDNDDQTIGQEELFGTIEQVDEIAIVLKKRGGESVSLPPYANSLQEAAKGQYTLATTLEIVTDPDYTAIWRLRTKEE